MPARRRFCILTHSGGGQVNDLTPLRRLRWTRLLSLPCQIAGRPWRAAAAASALRRLDSFSDLVPLYLQVSSFETAVVTSWIHRPPYSHSPAVVFFFVLFFFGNLGSDRVLPSRASFNRGRGSARGGRYLMRHLIRISWRANGCQQCDSGRGVASSRRDAWASFMQRVDCALLDTHVVCVFLLQLVKLCVCDPG